MKKNVAFIIPSLKNGGAERVLSTISMNLDENIKQYIFTWNGKDPDYDFNGKIVEIDVQNSTSLIKNVGVLLKRVREVRKYKKEYKIDTCISHLEGPNIVNLLSKGSEKTVITVHNFQSKERTGLYGFIFKILMKLLYNRADQIVVVSKAIKQDLVNNFNIKRTKIEVIYNPFDCKKIERLAEEELDDKYKEIFNNDVIINVGRLTEQKGQWNLIKSFYHLKKKNSKVKLVILGSGELEDRLKELVYNLGLGKDVIFLGFQSNPFKFVSKAKIFALTSLYEGFPMCIPESMACSTAIISVDCKSGPREILANNSEDLKVEGAVYCDYGVLTPEFYNSINTNEANITLEEEIFSDALNQMLKMDLSNYCKNGKIRVQKFNVDKIISRWIELIN
ncbi:glycosyltransferase [Romboutsia lituseburensis]|uniref:glycosyltransferase n=1 Tax=Romboutsia lituseburensis TaxID=1537 RepID=UPI00215A59B4|nr:glycosyltransferase [Romboutsia lituseburensis]MCR8746793.1 glycosyltransferase [Romboutsia lituseburensis]